MKKISLLIITAVITLSCSAQILPLENYKSYIDAGNGIPDNITHIKDVNNALIKFNGTWSGTDTSTSYSYLIQAYQVTTTFYGVQTDEVHLRYKITNNTGTVLENTLNIDADNYKVVTGKYLLEDGQYAMLYVGGKANCGQKGTIFLKPIINSNNTIEMIMIRDYDSINLNDCPNEEAAEQVMPINSYIILTKQ